METPILSAEEFLKSLLTHQLPKTFIVNEKVDIEGEAIPLVGMTNGHFEHEVAIRCIDNSINFTNCTFDGGLLIGLSSFTGKFSFENCTGKLLWITNCNVESLRWEGEKMFSEVSIVNCNWKTAYPNSYPLARLLELSKQGIHLKLSEILPYLGK